MSAATAHKMPVCAGTLSLHQKRDSETIMSMHRSLAASLWLLAAVGAYAVVAVCADAAQNGKVPPWILVVLFWGAALVSVMIHHLSRYLADHLAEVPDTLRRHGTKWSRAGRLQAGRLGRLLLS